jgi:hypothetical protein
MKKNIVQFFWLMIGDGQNNQHPMLHGCLIYFLLIFYLKFTHKLHQRKLTFCFKKFHPYKTIDDQGTDEGTEDNPTYSGKTLNLGPPYLLPTSKFNNTPVLFCGAGLLCCLLWILLIWSKEVIKGFHLRIQL